MSAAVFFAPLSFAREFDASHAVHLRSADIGLAFQIADDLLDVTGKEVEVGKKTQKDAGAGKATFVSLLGVDKASEQAHLLSQQAQEHLTIFGEKADSLRALATFIVERRS